jgi:iron complex outermembrane recepter protein
MKTTKYSRLTRVVKLATTILTTGAIGAYASTASAADAAPPNEADKDSLAEIVVTGVRASIEKGLEIKRDSVQVVEAIVAEDIGKLPDNNVVEALQRLSGVQVTGRSGGEAQTVSIRGFNDIETTWNGRNIFTASGRQFALQDIPSTLVAAIEVFKTRAADQIETGIAGQVDVKTLRPFAFKGAEVSLAARGIYLDRAKNTNPYISGLFSDRWETDAGEIGALVNVSYSRNKYSDQSATAGALVPFATADNPPPGYTPLQRIFTDGSNPWQAGLDSGLPQAPGSTINFGGTPYPYYLSRDAVFQNDLRGDRERPAVNFAFQWAPNSASEYTAEFFYDGFRNKTFNDLFFSFVDWWGNLGPDPASTITLYPGTNIIHTRQVGAVYGFTSGDYTKSTTNSYVGALNGKWTLTDKLSLEGDLSYQTSTFTSYFEAMRTERVANQINVNFNPGNGIVSFGFDDPSLLTNPAAWNVAQFYDNANQNKGNAITGTLDGKYAADLGPLQKITFGVRLDDRKANEANSTQSGADIAQPLDTFDPGLQYYNHGFFAGESNLPSTWVSANGYYVDSHVDQIRALYGLSKLPLFRTFDVDEKTYSGYIQGDLEQDILGHRLRAEAGVRYVRVSTDMDFFQMPTIPTDPVTSSSSSVSVGKFLPSVTLRFDVMRDWMLRFNYGETLRRPNFTDLNPIQNLTPDVTNVGLGGGTSGNPNLKATHSRNYDFTSEWYFAKDSAVYGTLFRRDIDGLVVPLTRLVNVPNANPNLNATNFLITSPVNASDGVMEGAELGVTYFPKGLPGFLDGLGLQASGTYLNSHQNIPQTDSQGDIVGQQRSPFFQVSKWSYNATLAYDHRAFEGRLSYVYRTPFLDHNEARVFANPIGVWFRRQSSLDLALNYNILPNAAISFDVVNLTNELAQSYYAFGSAGGPTTDNFGTTIIGRSFELGVRWKL